MTTDFIDITSLRFTPLSVINTSAFTSLYPAKLTLTLIDSPAGSGVHRFQRVQHPDHRQQAGAIARRRHQVRRLRVPGLLADTI